MPGPIELQRASSLALSGGGFRSTLFQIGTLKRLNELGLLRKITCISSVSGGSIANGFLAKQWKALKFPALQNVANNFDAIFTEPLMDFCKRTIDVPSLAAGLIDPFEHTGDTLTKAFADLLGNLTLQDIPDAVPGSVPRFVFNATSMQSGVRFWFSKEDAGDYRIGVTKAPRIPLARAVAASSAFPPFYAPVGVDIHGLHWDPAHGLEGNPISDILSNANKNNYADIYKTALLADGGVYDNMGLEALWNTYPTVWVSDAGAPFTVNAGASRFWIPELMRIIDIMMRSELARRRSDLIDMFENAKAGVPGCPQGAYWGMTTQIANYGVRDALSCSGDETCKLAAISTRLAPPEDDQRYQLVNWGYALCDAALRWHGQNLGPAPQWPFDKYPLG
jgi:NTE family protein